MHVIKEYVKAVRFWYGCNQNHVLNTFLRSCVFLVCSISSNQLSKLKVYEVYCLLSSLEGLDESPHTDPYYLYMHKAVALTLCSLVEGLFKGRSLLGGTV